MFLYLASTFTSLQGTLTEVFGITFGLIFSFFVALALGLLLWSFEDMRSRTSSWSARILMVLPLLIFPIGGVLIYLTLRPRQRLEEIAQRQLEEETLRHDLGVILICDQCHTELKNDFLVCPTCGQQVKKSCNHCNRLLEMEWAFCSYCGSNNTGDEQLELLADRYAEILTEIEENHPLKYPTATAKHALDTVADDEKAEVPRMVARAGKAGSRGSSKRRIALKKVGDDQVLEVPIGG